MMLSQPFCESFDRVQVGLNRPGRSSLVTEFTGVPIDAVRANVGCRSESGMVGNPSDELRSACDVLVHAYREEHQVNGIAIRIGRVYGPGRSTESLIATLISDALEGRSSRPPGDGTARYHYIYRDDVVSALILALDASYDISSAYNIAGHDIASDAEVANIVANYLPNADIVFGQPENKIITKRPFLDISAAQRDLHYLPKFDLNRGISTYIEWMKNQ